MDEDDAIDLTLSGIGGRDEKAEPQPRQRQNQRRDSEPGRETTRQGIKIIRGGEAEQASTALGSIHASATRCW